MGFTSTRRISSIDYSQRWDRSLLLIASLFGICFGILISGVWYLQIVRQELFQWQEYKQSLRIIRVPGPRGIIYDRKGIPIAENRPVWDLVVYLEDLRPLFKEAYRTLREQQGWRRISINERERLNSLARYTVISKIASEVSQFLLQPITVEASVLDKHYYNWPYRPFVLKEDLTYKEVARLLETSKSIPGVDLQVRSTRFYHLGHIGAHVTGYVVRDDNVILDEELHFNYSMPTYIGVVGIERGMETELAGKAGIKRIVVNSLCYRESEFLLKPPLAGKNVISTIDADLQQVVYEAMLELGPYVRGAAVVMDPNTGQILSLVSMPSYDPNRFIKGISHEEWTNWLNHPIFKPVFNRATQGIYPPGSVFKLVTGLACFQTGVITPQDVYKPTFYNVGYYQLGRRRIEDTAPPGWYDFITALKRSCNSYFINYGLKAGSESILSLGKSFGFGQRLGLPLYQESSGIFPSLEQIKRRWFLGNLANVCIGQEIAVTPLQVAVMTAAIVNGGKVLQPTIIMEVSEKNITANYNGEAEQLPRLIRRIPLPQSYFQIIKEGMLADTEDPDSTAFSAFYLPNGKRYLSQWRVGGKTGTAQVQRVDGSEDKVAWFTCFAPYEAPKYVVVVVVEGGISGGRTCAPIARKILSYLEKKELAATGMPRG